MTVAVSCNRAVTLAEMLSGSIGCFFSGSIRLQKRGGETSRDYRLLRLILVYTRYVILLINLGRKLLRKLIHISQLCGTPFLVLILKLVLKKYPEPYFWGLLWVYRPFFQK